MRLHARIILVGVVSAILGNVHPTLQEQPRFRADVELVQVDVVVTDRGDKPIVDLTADDFEIFQDGTRQELAEFRFVSVPAAGRAVEAAVTSAPRDTFDNAAAKDGRLFVLVLDDLHITLDAEKLYRLREIIVTFLRDLSPTDQVAVVYTSRSDLSQDFTTDLAAQVRALGRLREGLNARNIAPLAFEHDVRSSLFVLRNVSRALAGSPHPRRAIVYVAEGITLGFEWRDNPLLRQEALETFEAARRANVAIYAVDPRGLLTIGSLGDVHAQRGQKDSLYTLAINTGGLAFVEQSSLPRAAEAIVADNGSFYLLGYYPDPLVRDGKFHDITVRVKRPGVRVRARQGYVAPDAPVAAAEPMSPASAPTPSEAVLDPTLLRGVTVFGVPLRGFAAPIAVAERGRMKTIVSVEVAYLAPDGGALVTDELQYGLLAIDHDARPMASEARPLTFRAAQPGAARYLIHDVVDLPAGPQVIRVGITSRALGKTGTVHIPVTVPKGHSDRLAMSGLVIGRDSAVPSSRVDEIADWVPFEPTLDRTFARSDVLKLFARFFWRERDGDAVAVTIVVTRGDQVVHRDDRSVSGTPMPNKRWDGAFQTELPLAKLSPGAYELQVAGRLRSGTTVRRAVAFSIE